MVKSEPKTKPQSGGFFQKFFRKPEKSQNEQRLTVQRSIPYLEMGRDGICRVEEHLYSKTVRFYDINYQLAQNEDKNTIFESWCDFLNYFDASIRFQLSFINHKSDMSEYNKVIQIEPQHDQFDDVRMEYAQMLKQQLAKGNNGLVRTKYITFSIEAKSVREAKPRLERIETDILNNFKVLGVKAYPLNGVERLQIMYETFHQEEQQKFDFSYDRILQSGMTTKDFIAPTSFLFKSGKDFMMGDTYGAASYLNILAPELTDKVLAEFLDMDKNLVVSIHVQSVDQLKAIKLIKGKITDLDRMKIEEQKKAVRSGYDTRAVSRKEVEDYFEAKRCEMHAEIMFAWRKKQGAGFRLTNSVPFGYIRRNGESNMIKDEEVAPYLSEAFSRYASGRKMRDIAKWLNEQGVEPPMKHKKRILGKPYDEEPDQWTTDMLRCLFRNPTYTGAAANGSRQIIAENCHEPYITKEQFHAFPCNLREGENKISIRKSYKKPNPLAKHIVCTCGRALCWHKDKKTGEELFYCRYCRAHKENGKNLKVPAATIYKNVMDALELEHLEEEKLAVAIQQGAGKKAIEVVRAERSVQMKSVLAELNMEQFRRVPLYESYMANEITEEQYHAELMDYEEAHRKLNEQLTAIMEDKCIGHQITEKLLKALIMDQLHLFITQLSDRRKVVEELRKIEDVQNPVYRAKGEIMSLTDKVSQMAKKREQLYADYVAGVVDSEDYQLIREDYSRQYDGLRAALQEAENKKVQVEQQIEEYLNMTSHLEEHLDNFEFDIQLVKSLVQKIEVSADKRIRIVFGFRDVFTELGKESAET